MLQYHWTPPACPTFSEYGHDFTIDHSVSCPKGGFSSQQHNEVHDLTTAMMSEVCNNVLTESQFSATFLILLLMVSGWKI